MLHPLVLVAQPDASRSPDASSLRESFTAVEPLSTKETVDWETPRRRWHSWLCVSLFIDMAIDYGLSLSPR